MLDEAQKALLVDLVEADRRVPREKRESFLAIQVLNTDFAGAQILHPGWNDQERHVPVVDLEELASLGLLRSRSGGSRHDTWYSVTPDGVEQYTRIKEAQGQPIEGVQRQVRNYIDAEPFRERHPTAFKKWQEAEELLWKDDSPRSFTVIGHLCREAMQEFSASILRHENIPALELDKSKTVDRIRLFLNARKAKMGDSLGAFLDAFVALWGTLSDLAQRQEHGTQGNAPATPGRLSCGVCLSASGCSTDHASTPGQVEPASSSGRRQSALVIVGAVIGHRAPAGNRAPFRADRRASMCPRCRRVR